LTKEFLKTDPLFLPGLACTFGTAAYTACNNGPIMTAVFGGIGLAALAGVAKYINAKAKNAADAPVPRL